MTKWIAVLAGMIVLSGCLDKNDFSEIPEITYEDLTIIDNSVVIKFSFTDGDGDIGLRDNETYYPYGDCDEFNKNLIIDPYYLENGEYKLGRFVRESDCPGVEFDTVGYDQRIKYLVPEGKDKSLQGDIYVTINDALLTLPDDTILFKLTLIDRALHYSNEIETISIITPPI